MEDKNTIIKYRSATYGVAVCVVLLVEAAIFLLIGCILLPSAESIALFAISLFFVLFSLCLGYLFGYLNYIVITDKTVSTKKQTFLWKEVYITMSYYSIHRSVRGENYCIFFDDHYLSEEELYSRRVRKNAFYLMVTPERLDVILQKYNKIIKLFERPHRDVKGMYDRVYKYNQSLDNE